MIKVWVLFVWFTGSMPFGTSYDTREDCERNSVVYKRSVCVQVDVPKR